VTRKIVEPPHLEFSRVQVVIRVQMIHLDEADVCHFGDAFLGEAISWLVALHIRHHQDHTGPLSRGDHRFGFAHRRAHRFFDKDVLARFGRGDRRWGMRARGTHDHSVDVRSNQIVIVEKAPFGGYSVLRTNRVEQFRRQVSQATYLEFVVELT
jgi:hypothetical protein